jgi:cell division septation protein DedD
MDTALKQRLIGAAVLVALAVFFLPMLVKGPAPDSGVSDVSLKVPDGPDGAMETRDLPLGAPGDVPKGGAVGMDATPVDRQGATVPGLAPPPTGAEPAAGDPSAGDPAATSPDGATPPAETNATPAAAGGDYAVHFGAYATAKNADSVVALAKAAQLPAYSEPATVGGKAAWRVRIGPYSTRADAESARLKALAVRSDVPVRVVVLDAVSTTPTPTMPEPTPAAPATEAPKPAAATPIAAAKPEPKPAVVKPVALKPAPSKPETKPLAAQPAAVVPKPAVAIPAPAKPAAPKPVEAKPSTAVSAASKPATPMPTAPNIATTNPATPKPVAKPANTGALVAVAPKPKPATPATAAAAKVGFAVQLGAFSDAAEATALRDRLRGAGFAAFTETVNTDKGRLTRVRVGPVVDRAAADQLKAQVQSKTGVDGIVRSHP